MSGPITRPQYKCLLKVLPKTNIYKRTLIQTEIGFIYLFLKLNPSDAISSFLILTQNFCAFYVFFNSAVRLHFVSIKSLNENVLSVKIGKTKKEYKRAEEIENEAFEIATSKVLFSSQQSIQYLEVLFRVPVAIECY